MTNQGENKKLKRKNGQNIKIKALEDKLKNHRIKCYGYFEK
jgi:hypothetical protein